MVVDIVMKKNPINIVTLDSLTVLTSPVERARTMLSKIYEKTNEPVHEISNNVVHTTSKASDQPAHMRRLIRASASRLNIL